MAERSQARCKGSKFFQRQQQLIAKYRERKDRKSVTLNEEKYRALRKAFADYAVCMGRPVAELQVDRLGGAYLSLVRVPQWTEDPSGRWRSV